MDPTAALLELRRLAARYDTAGERPEDAYRLVDLVQGLDPWLTAGGFLTEPWAAGRK